ncbi:hypothetical protein PIROE2DRAFT_6671 [Piromyces sp. E2]|nr:hypothetical protein PIROE2DRAFT_6671 [Piromyces sp. E2]|eukprot:OUM66149.1 hypothetical protein PIROE2DRAFT_6671 [Piromyces sp. E2]
MTLISENYSKNCNNINSVKIKMDSVNSKETLEEIIIKISEIYKGNYINSIKNSILNTKFNLFYYIKENITKYKLLIRGSTNLNNLYTESFLKKNAVINCNNRFGFIKRFIYSENDLMKELIVNLNFLLRGDTENKQFYLVELNNIRNCKTISDLHNYFNKKNKLNINIQLVNTVSHKNLNDCSSQIKCIRIPLKIHKPNNPIYNIVIVSNGNIIGMSDFFSLITKKSFFHSSKIRNSFIQQHFNSFMNDKHNDFHYYLNSFFEFFDEKRTIQKIKSQFVFPINIYDINITNEEKNQNQISNDMMINAKAIDYINDIKIFSNIKKENSKDYTQDGFISNIFFNEKVIGQYRVNDEEIGIFRMDGRKVSFMNKELTLLSLCNEEMKIVYELKVIKLNENKYFLVEERHIIEEFEILKDKATITKVVDNYI